MTPDGEAGERVRQATAYLRRAMEKLPPASGRQLVGRALDELEAVRAVEGESDVDQLREGLRDRFCR